MVAVWQIAVAGLLTAVVVAITTRRWATAARATAAGMAFSLIVAWRLLCNALGLNEDFLLAISAGDLGCIPVGMLGPALMLVTRRDVDRRGWRQVVVAGVAAFLVNVVVL